MDIEYVINSYAALTASFGNLRTSEASKIAKLHFKTKIKTIDQD